MRTTASTPNLNCQHCNVEFKPKSGSVGKFCSIKCKCEKQKHDKIHGRSERFRCAVCHALIGLGIEKSGNLIGIQKQSISIRLKAAGIKRYEPRGGSWRNYICKPNQLSMTWWGGDAIAELWMQDYKVKFPTWSRMAGIKKLDIWITKYLKDEHAVNHHAEKTKAKNRASTRNANKKRKIIDPGFKVQCNLRRRLRDVMRSAKKGGGHHVSALIGCSTKQLAKHLESRFAKGMTWRNYGIDGWHVDHIIPCAKFDHNDPRQIAQCWHWTNLQPLWAKENMMKSDTITNSQMSLMLGGMH